MKNILVFKASSLIMYNPLMLVINSKRSSKALSIVSVVKCSHSFTQFSKSSFHSLLVVKLHFGLKHTLSITSSSSIDIY